MHICKLISQEQVLGIDTGRIVAAMKDVVAYCQFHIVRQRESHTMGIVISSLKPHVSISVFVF